MKKRPEANYSGIVFKLADVMREKGYSKNKLCVNCGLRFETVQGYYNGTISRVDLYVLAAMCRELECSVQDLMEYDPRSDGARAYPPKPLQPPADHP